MLHTIGKWGCVEVDTKYFKLLRLLLISLNTVAYFDVGCRDKVSEVGFLL